MLISISGSSGVGKTTLAQLICAYLGENDCLQISGDDLHRWERSDPMWDTYTHLNPIANDLRTGKDHLCDLVSGRSIERRLYNHETGKFDDSIIIHPKSIILYEGLHAFYDEDTSNLCDIRIYVDTDNDLKTEWKLKRDTKKRGYTRNQVLTTMQRRQVDEELYIQPQKNKADVVVKFVKNRNRTVSMDYVCVTSRGADLIESVKGFYDCLVEFSDVCKWLSMEPSLVQGRGGNVSVKYDQGLIVTSSGSAMSEVSMSSGYCVCDTIDPCTSYSDEDAYTLVVRQKKKYGLGLPSMETGFHANMKSRIVVHTHPIHVNAILCSNEAEQIISTVFKDLSYQFVPYTSPGFELVNTINADCSIVFLQNHGLIVGASSADEAIELTEKINNRCKRWLGTHAESFVQSDSATLHSPLFPDAAIFTEEMSKTNAYILYLMGSASLTPNYLSKDECVKLVEMKSEKHRRYIYDESKSKSVP
jgi:uridine kinase/ribulose-5-phosphate 4-epimerase/fuculose-1-phosphate aldolase